MRKLPLLCLSLTFVACGASENTDLGSQTRGDRVPLGKADNIGQCLDHGVSYCGKQSAGSCYCDTLCTSYGDCCADYEAACKPPTSQCEPEAKAIAAALDALNGWNRKATTVELITGHSDREFLRVHVQDAAHSSKDAYLMNVESMGGGSCYVYGLQLESQALDMTDDGAVLKNAKPSKSCDGLGRKAVALLEAQYGAKTTITSLQFVTGYSDREMFRALISRGKSQRDSYLLNAETMGGDPCYIYGLQLKSQEIDLLP